MKIGQVIGRAVMSQQDPSFVGGRWLLVNPLDASQLSTCCKTAPQVSALPTLVVYDDLGAGQGDIVGIVEGAEATAPFAQPIPIDALCVAIFDSMDYQPFPG